MAVSAKMGQDDIKQLEDCLLFFYPDEFVLNLIKSTKDVYENRYILLEIQYTDVSFRHLLHIITNASWFGHFQVGCGNSTQSWS